MNENRNLILAIVLSAAVLFGWQYLFGSTQTPAKKPPEAQTTSQTVSAPQPAAPGAPTAAGPAATHELSRKEALAQSGPRVAIDTPMVDGSIRLKGARFDDLLFKHYHTTVDPKSPEIDLLSPQGSAHPYYTVFGWVAAPGETVKMPGATTLWTLAKGDRLTPSTPVTLTWDNGQGLVFTRTISVDDDYMFTVHDTVDNKSSGRVTLYPYAYVARERAPKQIGSSWYLHLGFVGVANGSLKEATYSDFKDNKPPQTFSSTGGWVGITDKYWMAAVIPPQDTQYDGAYRGSGPNGDAADQADYRLPAQTVAPGASTSVTQRLFAGAKVVATLNNYEDKGGVQRFDLAVDWGWLWFFTKPIFWLLDLFYRYIGNFGVAILLLTVTIKLLFFPLANQSYKSMSRMKKLQPEMTKIKERFADDRQRQQTEMMELYKREKVNPVSGCLPMLIQIPVFFSLYQVLYVTIEMYHAPFFGWIQDLSAPDPTSIVNLFGLLPYHVPAFIPAFLSIGIWPVIMGFSQFISTKMNPTPADPVQAKMFAFMPLIFTFMMAGFPAGLVIYWTCSNLLTAAQQYLVMRRQGVEVHLFENLKLGQLGRWLAAPLRSRRND